MLAGCVLIFFVSLMFHSLGMGYVYRCDCWRHAEKSCKLQCDFLPWVLWNIVASQEFKIIVEIIFLLEEYVLTCASLL